MHMVRLMRPHTQVVPFPTGGVLIAEVAVGELRIRPHRGSDLRVSTVSVARRRKERGTNADVAIARTQICEGQHEVRLTCLPPEELPEEGFWCVVNVRVPAHSQVACSVGHGVLAIQGPLGECSARVASGVLAIANASCACETEIGDGLVDLYDLSHPLRLRGGRVEACIRISRHADVALDCRVENGSIVASRPFTVCSSKRGTEQVARGKLGAGEHELFIRLESGLLKVRVI